MEQGQLLCGTVDIIGRHCIVLGGPGELGGWGGGGVVEGSLL